MIEGTLSYTSADSRGAERLPNEVITEFRGSIEGYFQGIREEIPAMLTAFTRAVKDGGANKSPGGPEGKVGGSLIDLPATQTGPDRWESGIASHNPKLVWWHEFGTGERKEGGGQKYPITATKPHRMLVFEKEGKVRFIRGKAGGPAVVHHPGVRPSRMIRDSIKEQTPQFLTMLEQIGVRTRIL